MIVHRLTAFNTARGVENPLHNDQAAQKLGYRAGLVGGVDMYGYLTYAAVNRWGRQWLDFGRATCSLLKPVHEGDACDIVVVEEAEQTMHVDLRTPDGVCARAVFSLPVDMSAAPTSLIPERAPFASRPAASSETLQVGTVLPTVQATLDAMAASQFLLDERDSLAVYAKDGVLHPGYLLRLCNFTLSRNYILGPWIHTASTVRNRFAIPVGVQVEARGRVVSNFEKRGHLMVDIEVQLITEGRRVACEVIHSAIYKPRPH